MCKGDVVKGEYRSVYALGRQPTSDPGVHIQEGHQHFADNVVITSKVGFQKYYNIIIFVYLLCLEPRLAYVVCSIIVNSLCRMQYYG